MRDAAIKAGLPTEEIDDIMTKHARFANIAKYAGRVFFVADITYGTYNIINDPSLSNVANTAADLTVSSIATFGGPKGLAVAIVYHGGKQYVIMMDNAIQQGVVRQNPNPTRGYMPGLAPVFLIPNY